MKCPKCRYKYSKVFDVRKYFTFVLRSRRCKRCRHEWKTQETEISYDDFVKESFKRPISGKPESGEQKNLFGDTKHN